MKAISSLTLGAALLVTGVAFAQTPAQSNSEGTAPPDRASDINKPNAPAKPPSMSPSKATDGKSVGLNRSPRRAKSRPLTRS